MHGDGVWGSSNFPATRARCTIDNDRLCALEACLEPSEAATSPIIMGPTLVYAFSAWTARFTSFPKVILTDLQYIAGAPIGSHTLTAYTKFARTFRLIAKFRWLEVKRFGFQGDCKQFPMLVALQLGL